MRSVTVSLSAATVLVVALVGISGRAGDNSSEEVERGRYLVELADCAACHTPWKMGPHGPEMDTARIYSGHPQGSELPPPPDLPPGPWNAVTGGMTAWAGPWGVSYGANLTSDRETGLGAWSEEQFVAAMRTGKHLGMGRDILPPMPRYATATTGDLKAMFAYFMTVPPVRNQVPEPLPPAPPKPMPPG